MDPAEKLTVYLVGGAVRDMLLGLEVKDRDWVVTGATPDEMLALGFRAVGRDFPVFLHPQTNEEYALARTERKVAPGYHGFQFNSDPSVTLEQDLMRRDLTINAMAMDGDGHVIDPCGGRKDLHYKMLRHVSTAFSEDPVRILRTARFAARFADLEFKVDLNTNGLMLHMVRAGEVNALVAERVWREVQSALTLDGFPRFIEVLRDCEALSVILPEVEALFGVPQSPQYHPEIDAGIHVMLAIQAAIDDDMGPREIFAVLTHDLGKALTPKQELPSHRGHEVAGIEPIRALCDRLRVPKDYRQLALIVCEFHLQVHRMDELKPSTVLRLIEAIDAFRNKQRLTEFIHCCRADLRGRKGKEQDPYLQGDKLMRCFRAAASVDAAEIAAGYRNQVAPAGDRIKESVRRARISAIKSVLRGANLQNG